MKEDDDNYFIGLCYKCAQEIKTKKELVTLGDRPYHRKCIGKDEEEIE